MIAKRNDFVSFSIHFRFSVVDFTQPYFGHTVCIINLRELFSYF